MGSELQPVHHADKPLVTQKGPKLEASVQPLYEDITDTEDDEKSNSPLLDDGRIHTRDILAGNIEFLKYRSIEDQFKILRVIDKCPMFYQRLVDLDSDEQQRCLNKLFGTPKEPVRKLDLHF